MKPGWEVKPLGEMIEPLETVDPRKEPTERFTYIDVSSVSRAALEVAETSEVLGARAPSRARRKVRENDVIFATIRPTLKRIATIPANLDKAVCSTGYMVLRPKNKLDHRYLFYSLQSESFEREMETLQRGASYPAVSDGDIRAQKIPIPPLEEQKRIVAVLDAAFEGLTRAKENAEANLQNARELFVRTVEERFERLVKVGQLHCIDQIAQVKGGKRLPKGAKFAQEKTDYPYISVKNFTDDGSVDETGLGYLDKATHEAINRYIIRKEDMYISIAGTIGKTGIIPDVLDGANLTENAARLVFVPEVLNEFVYYFSTTANFQEQVGINTRVAAQPKLALMRLKTVTLPIVDLKTQRDLIAEFDATRLRCLELEAEYRSKLTDIADLRQSLLQKAFAGELT